MHVVSLAPIPVASLIWRHQGAPSWWQTVVGKLTFRLTPPVATLAKRHDPIHDRDRFADDDPDAPVYAPADLVPTRPRVDVTAVGPAWAPGGVAATSIPVRLAVGTLDKRVVVTDPGGIVSADLSYAHGPRDAHNPWPGGSQVSAAADDAGASHTIAVAHDGEPEDEPTQGGDERIAAAPPPDAPTPGFGPLAAHWPSRTRLLGPRNRPPPTVRPLTPTELPSDLDPGFFNAAPREQQLDHLAPDAWLTLEHLHREHASLRVQLPDVAPQVFVERDREREEVDARITSLWLDTDRAVVTVTWHARVKLAETHDADRIWVVVAGPGRRVDRAGLSRVIASLRPDTGAPPSVPRVGLDEGEEDTQTHMFETEEERAAVAARSLADTGGTRVVGSDLSDDGMPEWMRVPPSGMPPPPRPRRRPSLSDPPGPTLHGLGPPPGGWGGAGTAPPLAPSAPPPPSTSPPASARPPAPRRLRDTASLPASPAATASPPPAPSAMPPRPPRPPAPSLAATAETGPSRALASDEPRGERRRRPRRRRAPRVVEMLWFDAPTTPLVRQRFDRLCARLDFSPADAAHDRPALEGLDAEHHHLHFGVLTEAPRDEARSLGDRLRAAISDTGRFTAPLVVLEGTLSFPFDDTDRLRATTAVVKPLAGADPKVGALIDHAEAVLASPVLSPTSLPVRQALERLHKLFGQQKRVLTSAELDATVTRGLLERRQYARRKLLGGDMIRAAFDAGDPKHPLVAYLPRALEDRLPLMTRFEARLLVEAHLRQDEAEAHPHALRVITLGRVHTMPK
ncbi:MAG: DUF2169 domain-containing protein [Myxococcota bacterium]